MKLFVKFIALFAALGLILSMAPVKAQDGGFQVIVNNANSTDSASKKDVSKWFLKKKTTFDNGTEIMPADQKSDSDVRAAFTEAVHGKSVNGIKSYWQKQIFSGKGTPPTEKATDAEVIAFVIANAGGIGYVSAGADVSGVKVITVK